MIALAFLIAWKSSSDSGALHKSLGSAFGHSGAALSSELQAWKDFGDFMKNYSRFCLFEYLSPGFLGAAMTTLDAHLFMWALTSSESKPRRIFLYLSEYSELC